MTLALRPATLADAELVCNLFRTSFTETFGHLYAADDFAVFMAGVTTAAFEQEIADPAFRFQLASVDGEPTGFAKVGPAALPGPTPDATRELRQLYVLNRFTGSGVGAALMDWVLADARAGGARHLQLSVFIDNHRARRFYEKRGFVRVGRYDFMVGNHADEDIVMRAAL